MAREDHIPAAPGGKQVYLLSRATIEKLMAISARPEVKLDPTQFVMIERGGTKFYRFKTPQGKPDTTKKGGWDRFGVWVDEARQKLMVDVGSIIYQGAVGGSTFSPIFPLLGDVLLNEKDENGWGPGFDIAGKSTGVTYTLVLTYEVMECGETWVEYEDPAQGINELKFLSPGELDALELEDNVAAVIVAEVKFTDGDLGLKIDTLDQLLGSDWHPLCSDDSDSESGSSSEASSSSESSSDPSSDDDSNESGGSDSEDPDDPNLKGCCPNITIEIVSPIVLAYDVADCFDNTEAGLPQWGTVSFDVSVLQVGMDACGTNCRNWYATVTVQGGSAYLPGGVMGGASLTVYLGLGGAHTFGVKFRLNVMAPCDKRSISVLVKNAGGANLISPENRERCINTACTEEASFVIPPWCGDDCESSDSTPPTTIIDSDSSASSSGSEA